MEIMAAEPEISSDAGVIETEETEVVVGKSGPHTLERKWTFWFDNQSKAKQPGAAWGSTLRSVYTFDTIEEFWGLYDQIFRPSKLEGNVDFHLFKTGIEPKWEDPECANGGKWSLTVRKSELDTMWLETLMALIGEQFDEADEICGAVVSVRQRQDKLALWTKNASNEAAQISIGKKWKEIIDYNDKIIYNVFDDAKKEKSVRGGRYSV